MKVVSQGTSSCEPLSCQSNLTSCIKKYQIENNSSRKMLEQIVNEVGLRKQMVQVWFQNTTELVSKKVNIGSISK